MAKDLFSKQAAVYARSRPTYPEALFEFLASLPARRETVWDCACGSGQASAALARYFDRVVATDLSERQIAEARPGANILYRVATAEDSGLPDASVDLTTAAQAAHWFHLDPFYAEVRRVSRPGAVVALWGYGLHSVAPGIDPLLNEYYAEIVGPYWPPEVKWVLEKYQTLPFPFEEIEAPAFRMELDWTLGQMTDYWRSWSATQRFAEATGRDPLDEILPRLERAWGAPETKRRVVWPVHMRVGRVTAGGRGG